MLVFAREVFVCKCSTHVPLEDPHATDDVKQVRWVRGTEEHLARVEPEYHSPARIDDLRERLRNGEAWSVGLLDDRIVSCTWLHTRGVIDYPYLPGCTFGVAGDVGYGYDAWTPSDLRGGGLRRAGFLEELRILRELGKAWETSFFVKDQLEGATRSLRKVGIEVVPLWRAHVVRRSEMEFELLAPGDPSTWRLEAEPAARSRLGPSV
jgi:hypothetical protein